MRKDLSLADFTKVAGNVGFTDKEISRLFKTEDIHSASMPDQDQILVLKKIISLSALCGDNWLDGPPKFRLGADLENQSAREIITSTEDGLNKYVAAAEFAAGGPLLNY